jgi:hypothetical protein
MNTEQAPGQRAFPTTLWQGFTCCISFKQEAFWPDAGITCIFSRFGDSLYIGECWAILSAKAFAKVVEKPSLFF